MKTLYRLADRLRRAYWFVRRPTTRGVKCVIENDGKWLMIRNTYGRRCWTFPGGKVGRREDPAHAARREALEEVGVRLHGLEFIGSYKSNKHHKHDTVYCFRTSTADRSHRVDGREVEEADWFPPTALPEPHGASVDRIMSLLSTRTRDR